MSGHVVSVDVTTPPPIQVIEVDADNGHVDIVLPPAPTIEVDIPTQPPVSVDVIADPPVVLVSTTAPPPPVNVDVEMPDPVTVDVIATPPAPVRVDALAAWQAGISDAPADGVVYGRLNKTWAGALGLLAPYAPLNSPTLVGVPTAPTPPPGANSTQIATTQFVEATVLASHHDDLVTSVAAKIGDVVLYTTDLEDWDIQIIDGGSF
jgi:hypothetical protein